MAKRIIDVTASSGSVSAGADVTIDVTYESAEGGDLKIEYGGKFDGTPTSVPLPAGGAKQFTMAIVRTGDDPGTCLITFRFGNKKLLRMEVT